VAPVIAVVDDSHSVRKAVIRLLRAAGHAACGFASGSEFLQLRQTSRIRCLILDVEMPGFSGIDLQRELNRRQAGIPVIIMTARDSPSMREECARLGALAFLSKPMDILCLLDAVAVALQSKTHPLLDSLAS
jgi:FixJ family two-component response regulator